MTVAESPRRLTRRDALAALVGGGAVLGFFLGRQPSSEPQSVSKETTTEPSAAPSPQLTQKPTEVARAETTPPFVAARIPEATPTPEVKKGALWQVRIEPNFLFSPTYWKQPDFDLGYGPLPSHSWSGSRLFVRAQGGRVQEVGPEIGTTLWDWGDPGVVLASDENGVFIQHEETSRVHVLNPKTKEEIGRIIPPEGLSKQELSLRLRGLCTLNNEVFIRTLGPLTPGIPFRNAPYQDGFAVFSRDGKPLWETPRNEPHFLRDLVGNTIIDRGLVPQLNIVTGEIRSAGGLNLWNAKTGELIASIPGVETFTHDGRFLAASSKNQKERYTVYVYDLDNGKKIYNTDTMFTLPAAEVTVMSQQIHLIGSKLVVRDLDTGDRRITIILETSVSRRFQRDYIYDYTSMTEFGQKIKSGTLSEIRQFILGETEARFFSFLLPPGVLIASASPEISSAGSSVWKNEDVSGLSFLGESGGNLIFGSWPKQPPSPWELGSDSSFSMWPDEDWGRARIYGVDPSTGKRSWPPVELGDKDTRSAKVTVRSDTIWAISNLPVAITKIDAKTGRPGAAGRIGQLLRTVDDKDKGVVFIETEATGRGGYQLTALRP